MATQAFTVDKPESGASATVTLPEGNGSTLSFNTADIQGMQLSDSGELIISFTDGGSLTIDNFRELADNEVQLALEDGSVINSKDLFETLVSALPPTQITGPLGAEAIAYNIEAGRKYEIDFNGQKPVDVSEQDGALLITFENGGLLVLHNFQDAMASEMVTELSFEGQFLTLREFADGLYLADAMTDKQGDGEGEQGQKTSSMEDIRTTGEEELAALAQELAGIEPAAGEGAGAGGRGGYGFNSSFEATPLNSIDDIGPIDPTALLYGLPDFGDELLFVENFQQPDGPPVPLLAIAPAMVYEDGSVLLSISADPVASGAYVTIKVAGIPADWGVNPNGGTYDPATGIWEYTGTPGAVFNGGPILSPPADSDVDISTLLVNVTNTSSTTGLTSGTAQTTSVITDAVADDPRITAAGGTEVEGTPIDINIDGLTGEAVNALPGVADGSETITRYEIGLVPPGFNFGGVGTDLGGGVWSFTPAEIVGLQIVSNDPGFDGTLGLTATVYTQENPNDAEFDLTNNTNSATTQFIVTWTPVINPPTIDVNGGVDNIIVKEDGTIDVTVKANLSVGAEPDEYLTVTITGFNPAWGTYSAPIGSFNGAMTEWTVTLPAGTALDTVFTFSPAPDSDIDMTGLVAVATATSPSEGISASSGPDSFNVMVDAVADAPQITANGSMENEGTPIDITIFGATGEASNVVPGDDGSETIDHYEIYNVPAGFNFGGVGTDLGSGVWSFTPAEIVGLKIYSTDPNFDGKLDLTAKIVTKDNPSDFEDTLADNTAEATDDFSVTWKPTINPPVIKINNGVAPIVVKEDGSKDVRIEVELSADAESAEFLYVKITGFDPAWGTVTATSGAFINGGTEWEITLPAGTDLDTVFTFSPDADSDIDLNNLVVEATVIDPIEDVFANSSDDFDVITDAVADTPDLSANNATGEEGTTIPLTITTAATDTDGSEVIKEVRISGLPAGATLTAGTENGGVWTLTPGQLAGLGINVPDGITGDFDLTVVSVATEDPVSDNEVDFSDNEAEATTLLKLTVTPDDEPIIAEPEHVTVDETNLSPTVSVSDKVEADFGSDTPGVFSVNGNYQLPTGLTSLGDAVTVSFAQVLNGNGEYTGTAGGRTVFTLTLEADGDYTFTLFDTLDHPVDGPTAADHDDPLDLKFGVNATDSDGDVDDGFITVTVRDDGPIARSDFNQFDITVSDKDYNIVLMLDVSGSMGGNKLALLKSSVGNLLGEFNAYDGGEIKVHIVPFATSAGAGQTFTVTSGAGYNDAISYLNGLSASGNTNYEAPMQSAIAWLQGATANDPIAGADTYTYFVSDGAPNRYNTASGNANSGGQVNANVVMGEITGSDGTNEVATLQGLSTKVISVGIGVDSTTLARLDVIDSEGNALDVQDPNDLDAILAGTNPIVGSTSGNVITGVNGGAGAVDYESQDTPNLITKIAFGGTVVNVPTTGTATINGDFGTLKIAADGSYTYELSGSYSGGAVQDTFVYTVMDGDGDISSANLVLQGKFAPVNAHVEVNNGVDEVRVKEDGSVFVSVEGGYTGGNGNETMTLTLTGVGPGWGFSGTGWTSLGGGSYQITMGTGINSYNGGFTLTPPAQSDIDLSGLSVAVNVTGPDAEDSASGSDAFSVVVDAVADKPSIVADDSSAEEGQPIDVDIVGSLGVDTDGSEMISHYTISGVPLTGFNFGGTGTNLGGGVWSFTPAEITNLKIYSANSSFAGSLNLTATVHTTENPVSDGEYDMSDNNNQASDGFKVTWNDDDEPIITQPEIVTVDESNLTPKTQVSDSISADFGDDTPGTFTPNSTVVTSSVPLTHEGNAVVVERTIGGYVGRANGDLVFVLDLNVDGTYSFHLYDTLDHPLGGSNHNDSIAINFGFTATDSDGDSTNGIITVNVLDDGLKANNDLNQYDSAAGTANGNVITGLNGGAGAADDLSFDTPNSVTKIAFGSTVINVPSSGTVSIDGDHGTLTIAADGTYTYNTFPGTGGSADMVNTLNVNSGHVAGTASSINVNGFTLTSSTGGDLKWVSTTDGSGVGIVGQNSDKIYNNEKLFVGLPQASDSVKVTIADIGANNLNSGIEFKVYLASGGSVDYEFSIATTTPVNGLIDVTLDAAKLGLPSGTQITGFDLYSSDAGSYAKTSQLLKNVTTTTYGDPDCDCDTDTFTYTLRDGDGDTSTATLTLDCVDPLLIVGENVSDKQGSTTDYHVGIGEGTIAGGIAGDILIGDVGGSSLQNVDKDYNIVLMLDVSGSMGSSNNSSSRLSKLINATENLLSDLGAYNGGDVKVHIVPFSTDAHTAGTFNVTTTSGLAAALNFINNMPEDGWTNYEAALQSAISWLQGDLSNDPISGAETISYFISDGEPNRYLNNSGNVVNNDDPNISMNQINGNGDSTDEIEMIQSLSDEVIGVGIEIGGTTLARLGQIDSDGNPINVTNVNDLDTALQGASPLNKLAGLGNDVINGGEGNDLIFGDAVYTDLLAAAKGLGTNPGAGWAVFEQLEATSGWDRDDTIAYIRSHAEELGAESVNGIGEARQNGNDTLSGGAGDDIIFGQEGNDVISGGLGNDTLYGGSGADRFLFESIADSAVDTIKDFDSAEGDVLDLSLLLSGTGATQATIDNFVFASQSGGNTILKVDLAGSAVATNGTTFAVLEGVTGLSVDDLVTSGSLVS